MLIFCLHTIDPINCYLRANSYVFAESLPCVWVAGQAGFNLMIDGKSYRTNKMVFQLNKFDDIAIMPIDLSIYLLIDNYCLEEC